MGKCGKNDAVVNIDEILRIGSVLERHNLEQKKREAFDWLAENRERIHEDRRAIAEHLNIAVGDLIMSRELVRKVFGILMNDEVITKVEYEKNFRRFEGCSDEQLPTVAQIAYLLKENCAYFQPDEQ